MLGSWFSSKSSESVNKEADPLRRSSDAVRDDAAKPESALPRVQPIFSTPHDDILAEFHGLHRNVDQPKQSGSAISTDGPKKDDGGKQSSPAEPTAGPTP